MPRSLLLISSLLLAQVWLQGCDSGTTVEDVFGVYQLALVNGSSDLQVDWVEFTAGRLSLEPNGTFDLYVWGQGINPLTGIYGTGFILDREGSFAHTGSTVQLIDSSREIHAQVDGRSITIEVDEDVADIWAVGPMTLEFRRESE